MTAAYADPNDVGLQDITGLGLAHGYSVWCHYEPADDERIAAYVKRYPHPVMALRERAGVVVEGDTITAAGFEPVVVFTASTRLTVSPASPVPPAPTGSPAA